MMCRAVCVWVGLALLAPGSIVAASPDVEGLASGVENKVLEWRRDIHQHPELGNREFRTAALVAEHLQGLGMEVRTGIAHTGVVGILRGARPGPRIALRADMDALPVTEQVDLPFASRVTTEFRGQETGVMHACGHDAHVAILMGVAEALAGMRDELPGEVMFIFQPAEEGAPEGEEGGAALMLREGLFDGFQPAAVFGLHVGAGIPSDVIAVRPGPFMAAADAFRIVVKGRQAHGSRPWSAIDPIVVAAEIVGSAQTLVSRRADLTRAPVVVSFGAIQGGIRQNIIPDEVELIGTIRTFEPDMREDVFKRAARHRRACRRGARRDGRVGHSLAGGLSGDAQRRRADRRDARGVDARRARQGHRGPADHRSGRFLLLRGACPDAVLLRRRNAAGPGHGGRGDQSFAVLLSRRGRPAARDARHARSRAGGTTLTVGHQQELPMNKDQLKGRVKKVTGKVKEVAGKAVGNKKLEREGKSESSTGKAQAGYGDVRKDLSRLGKDVKKGL
jgi:amidohydrolase